MVASASRLILSSSLRCRVNLSSWYSGLSAAFCRPEFRSRRWSQVISVAGRSVFTVCAMSLSIPTGFRPVHYSIQMRSGLFLRLGASGELSGESFHGLAERTFPTQRGSHREPLVNRKIIVRKHGVDRRAENLRHILALDPFLLPQTVHQNLVAFQAESEHAEVSDGLTREM